MSAKGGSFQQCKVSKASHAVSEGKEYTIKVSANLGSIEIGTHAPERIVCGNVTTGFSCMTWNSVVTKFERNAPKLSEPAESSKTMIKTANKLPQ